MYTSYTFEFKIRIKLAASGRWRLRGVGRTPARPRGVLEPLGHGRWAFQGTWLRGEFLCLGCLGCIVCEYILYIYIYIIHIYIPAYIRTYGLTYIHACIHPCIHTCIHTYIHTYIYIHTYRCLHTYIWACIRTYIRAYTYICIPSYTDTAPTNTQAHAAAQRRSGSKQFKDTHFTHAGLFVSYIHFYMYTIERLHLRDCFLTTSFSAATASHHHG